ncbi:MAG TPA: hemerythrin family protein [Verrucomicrobiae bacterium]|nr:hemerythrin family protein [Verrucomicrobiae bacterium]
MAIIWGDYLSTHIEWIDEQHKELFRRLNAFLDACDQGKGQEDLLGLLRFLDDYIDAHFSDEERFMKEEGYSQVEMHIRLHRGFVREMSDFKRRFLKGADPSLLADIGKFTVSWLLDHIARKDKDFAVEILTKKMTR